MVDINCGALPKDLIEGELFGRRRGAYTGALEDREGLIAEAEGGSLFLDELSSLPVEGQIKLLRTLDTREVRRLGDTRSRRIDFRLIGAVQQNLEREVREGRFRLDLFQRVAGVIIELPPLTARLEDVLPLARFFAGAHRRQLGPGAVRVLENCRWPGNIRELRSVIERAVVLSGQGPIESAALVEAIDLGTAATTAPVANHVEKRDERMHLLQLAERNGWNRKRMAAELGLSVATMYRRLKQHGVIPR